MKEGGNRKNGSSGGGGFESLGLSPEVFRGIKKIGFRVPTPVQRKALPVCLSGKDAVVMARTGSGKTAAFVLTVLERLLMKGVNEASTSSSSIRAVILSPTRELALQTLKVTNTLASFTSLKAVGIVGGDSIEGQFNTLASKPDIIVATPGRLSHLLREIPDLTLLNCRTLVLDEADRLLEMGFALQLREICSPKYMPSPHNGGRQTMLFSATLPKSLVELTKNGIVMSDDPQVVRLEKEANVSEELRVGFITCRSQEKDAALIHLVRDICTTLPAVQKRFEVSRSQQSAANYQRVNSKKSKKDDSPAKKHDEEETDISAGKIRDGLVLIFAATRHHVEFITTLLKLHDIAATQIYGTMDHEARQLALGNFRRGVTPVLVVTDVAARGIDVPLIDVVIHHSFPPSPKLFVHRSGRAARAGRIGYCFALVDTEELPYMTDLHLFLGRSLSNQSTDQGYSLQDMTPDMVQYGTVPESVLTVEVENINRLLEKKVSGGHAHDIDNLVTLHRTCQNAMKQFRKTRPDASRQGVRRAKALLSEDDKGTSTGLINVKAHPVLMYWEKHNHHLVNQGHGATDDPVKQKEYWENKQKRDEFLQAMATFRPKETIFESQAGNTSKGVYSSQVDKSSKSQYTDKQSRLENALIAMKGMRRQMKLARSKGESMVVAGSQAAEAINEQVHIGTHETNSEQQEAPSEKISKALESLLGTPTVPTNTSDGKTRMSKAERKRAKKLGVSTTKNDETVEEKQDEAFHKKAKQMSVGTGEFRDEEHFIDVEKGYDERSRTVEASLQPSSDTQGRNDLRTNALRLEETMLDLVGDENADMVKHHRIMRWDKSKRKYIQTTLAAATSETYSKRIKLESGQTVKFNDDRAKLGQLYEKWQKKTNQSIGRTGVFDDGNDDNMFDNGKALPVFHTGKGKKHNDGYNNNDTDKQNLTHRQKRLAKKMLKADPTEQKLQQKTVAQLRKEREAKDKLKIKNMEKGSRERLLLSKKQEADKSAMKRSNQMRGRFKKQIRTRR